MDAFVVGEFGVEGGGHGFALADGDGVFVFTFGSENLDTFSEVNDFRGADENHLERRFGGLVYSAVVVGAAYEFAFADGAVDLASIGIAADVDVECAESGLRGIFNFRGQQDSAGAGAEGGLGAHEFFQLGETFFSEKFQECAGFAAGDDEAVNMVELFGFFDEHNFGAQLFEPAAVRVEIALQGQDSDFQDEIILPDGR